MQQLNFTSNWNGKLFLPNFGTVRPHNPLKYGVDKKLEVFLKNEYLGTINIVAVRTFRFCQITDALSHIDVGHPAHYMAALLKKFYGNDLAHNSKFDHVICQYISRHLPAQQRLLQEWWQHICDTTPNAHDQFLTH